MPLKTKPNKDIDSNIGLMTIDAINATYHHFQNYNEQLICAAIIELSYRSSVIAGY